MVVALTNIPAHLPAVGSILHREQFGLSKCCIVAVRSSRAGFSLIHVFMTNPITVPVCVQVGQSSSQDDLPGVPRSICGHIEVVSNREVSYRLIELLRSCHQ